MYATQITALPPPPTTGGTCIFLSVFLLVNKFQYWLSGSWKTYVVKPSFIVQEKLLFHEKSCLIYVKDKWPFHKNYFLPWTYLVYVCTYVYHEYARKWYVYIYFHVFRVIFGLTMTTSFYLYPVLRFNMVDILYLLSLNVGSCCDIIRICYHTVFLLDLQINVCIYICIFGRDDVVW